MQSWFAHVCVDRQSVVAFATGNITVSGEPIKVWDSYRRQYREVFPILVFAFADTPARRGWALTTGHTGFRGCDKCGIRGVRTLSSGVKLNFTAFCGYCEKVPVLARDALNKVCNPQ